MRLMVVETRWRQRRSAASCGRKESPAIIAQTDLGAGAGDAVGDSGPREILVAQDDLERAQQLVTTDAS